MGVRVLVIVTAARMCVRRTVIVTTAGMSVT